MPWQQYQQLKELNRQNAIPVHMIAYNYALCAEKTFVQSIYLYTLKNVVATNQLSAQYFMMT